MKLLVTGGAGFIGSNFIHYLRRVHPEYDIVNLDKLTYAGNLENLKSLDQDPRYQFVKGDICDRDLVFDLVKDVDAIVHFAAETHVDRAILGAADFVKTNVLGTLNLLDAAKEFKKRFHHISTDEVFGALGPNDPPFNEHTPYNPKNPYSASKAAADHLVRSYIHTHKIAATISNCSNNYGPYQFPEKLIPLFISKLLNDERVPVYGDGQQIRDWIHVEDHARGVDLILHRGRLGETYCLGGNCEIPNLELIRGLIALMGKDETLIEYVKDRPGHDRRYAINFTKARNELSWEPRIKLEEGLQKTIDWYQKNQDWVDRCKSGEYQEYYVKNYSNK
ncbi:dTDP-glucose 4,6-dehydratase [Patescibacteria group bacterium]|nr:dTDP-glucose 4,6-dehydratase [Patescibacteria group bacterium]MBU1705444.1 dTDP-glucose 4,6-dehydratase [Patescibacteria group bacterium]